MFEREMKELSQIGQLGVSLYFPFILVQIISGKYHYCKAEAALYASFQASVCFYPGLTPSFFFFSSSYLHQYKEEKIKW